MNLKYEVVFKLFIFCFGVEIKNYIIMVFMINMVLYENGEVFDEEVVYY